MVLAIASVSKDGRARLVIAIGGTALVPTTPVATRRARFAKMGGWGRDAINPSAASMAFITAVR